MSRPRNAPFCSASTPKSAFDTAAPVFLETRWRRAVELRQPTGQFPRVISITVNGDCRQFSAPLNCAELLNRLELSGKRVALERNGEIVPRSRYADQPLADGDSIEIVVAVGGG